MVTQPNRWRASGFPSNCGVRIVQNSNMRYGGIDSEAGSFFIELFAAHSWVEQDLTDLVEGNWYEVHSYGKQHIRRRRSGATLPRSAARVRQRLSDLKMTLRIQVLPPLEQFSSI